MQIKSWHIALIGIIFNSIFPLYLAFLFVGFWIMRGESHEGTSLLFFLGIVSFILLGIILISVIFLRSYNRKKKKIGAILSMIFGAFQIFIGFVLICKVGSGFPPHFLVLIICISGLFLFGAGVLYFWKETKIKELYKKKVIFPIVSLIVLIILLIAVIFFDDVKNYYMTNFITVKRNIPSNMSAREIIGSKLQEIEIENGSVLPIIHYELPDVTVCLYNSNENLAEMCSVIYKDENNHSVYYITMINSNQRIKFYLKEDGQWGWGNDVNGGEIFIKYDELLLLYDVGMNNASVCDHLDEYNVENIEKIKILK